jgi:hypothetical protein
MKKLLALLCTLGIAQPAMAGSISTLDQLGQAEFHTLSNDLGAALSYKPVTPAASLGVIGFDLGVEVTQTDMTKSSAIWSKATGGGSAVSKLYVPKIHVAKGLPFGIDVAAFVSRIPTTNISLYGAELRYAIIDGGIAMPAVALRGAYTKLSGVSQLAFDTKSLDLSISKGFAFFTPYAGVGGVWVNSKANVNAFGTTLLLSDKITQGKVFAGANLNLGLTNIAAEMDKTGNVRSVSLKMGFRF